MTVAEMPFPNRPAEIVAQYQRILEGHLNDLRDGKALKTWEIADIAEKMHIHPVHLSNTIREVTGNSPCYFFESGLMRIARELILSRKESIASIARHLMYDPSNFNKFFRRFEGITPLEFRKRHQTF